MSIKKYHKSENLFDYHTMSVGMTGKYLTADGSVGDSVNWNTTDYIPVDSSIFTVGRIGGISPAICLYDENKNFIGGQAYGTGEIGFKEYTTVTAGSVAKFARFSYYTVSDEFYDDLSKIMLVEGSIHPTSYIPYGYIWSQIPYRKYGTETDAITTLPATVIGDGTPISSYVIKGNLEQTGTPTPSSPIYPSECGERTENLFDISMVEQGGWTVTAGFIPIKTVSGDSYHNLRTRYSEIVPLLATTLSLYCPSNIKINYAWVNAEGYSLGTSGWQRNGDTVTAPEQAASMIIILGLEDNVQCTPSDFYDITIVAGSTPPTSYIPYGYKLPLTLGSTTTDIYLGEVQTTRRIKKLVLTGEEVTWGNYVNGRARFIVSPSGILYSTASSLVISDRYNNTYTVSQLNNNSVENAIASYDGRIYIYTNGDYDIDTYKSYLAQQYANGTPVTIWYVLATSTTGIVNEPIRKIGDYVDSVSGTNLATSGTAQFDVDTTLKPSEVDMTYHGWHEHEDMKYST